jgi:uncharacterized membrane protein YhaH (DUF805 family)
MPFVFTAPQNHIAMNNPYQASHSPVSTHAGPPPGLKSLLFSPHGRIRRTDWWKSYGLVVLAVVLGGLLDSLMGMGICIVITLLLGTYVITIATIKRMHDHGKSGWFQLISLIPLVGLYIFVLCGCTRGNVGPNRFGPDPV